MTQEDWGGLGGGWPWARSGVLVLPAWHPPRERLAPLSPGHMASRVGLLIILKGGYCYYRPHFFQQRTVQKGEAFCLRSHSTGSEWSEHSTGLSSDLAPLFTAAWVGPEPASPCKVRVPIVAPLPAREPYKPGSWGPSGEKVCGSLRERVPKVTGSSLPCDVHAGPGGFLEGWPTLRVWGPVGNAVDGDEAGTAVLVKEKATPCHWEKLTPVHPQSHLCPHHVDGALSPALAPRGGRGTATRSSRWYCLPDGGVGLCGPVHILHPHLLLLLWRKLTNPPACRPGTVLAERGGRASLAPDLSS